MICFSTVVPVHHVVYTMKFRREGFIERGLSIFFLFLSFSPRDFSFCFYVLDIRDISWAIPFSTCGDRMDKICLEELGSTEEKYAAKYNNIAK